MLCYCVNIHHFILICVSSICKQFLKCHITLAVSSILLQTGVISLTALLLYLEFEQIVCATEGEMRCGCATWDLTLHVCVCFLSLPVANFPKHKTSVLQPKAAFGQSSDVDPEVEGRTGFLWEQVGSKAQHCWFTDTISQTIAW